MLKIKALNQESSSDEDVPTIRREAQEEIALELYNNALRALAQKDYDQSASVLKQLIETNIPQLEINGSLPKLMSTLQYSCYVNLGNIYVEKESNCEALECFTKASELDSTDVTLWAKLGKLALKENKFNKAAYAFSKGLECSETHWPCLDNLVSVLYAIKDTMSCLVYIGKALALDADYIKGIVLRKQIYKDNPAAKEYYQLYNPDHVYEPPVDVEIDNEEEEDILRDAELLCRCVTETEKSVGFKPFETIPLPKTLEEYNWLSLTKCIIYCHQYITDHNMSHFTTLDISKCMSQSGESGDRSGNKSPGEAAGKDSTKSVEGKSCENVLEEKMDTEPVVSGRRFSQVSDITTGNDNLDNTPSQTDNDEEQNMELDDNETDGDNQDAINALQQSKKGKRKRDVLSDLQIWGWHSKRKPPKKIIKDYTVEDAINRIIPKNLLLHKVTRDIFIQGVEDSMDTMDIYNMYVEDKELNFLSPIHSPKSVNFEEYFGTDRESYDVLNFWTKKRIVIDAVVLVKDLVVELAKLWKHKWPKELILLYIQLFKMFREHFDQPQPLCSDQSPDQIKEDALATLLYGELLAFSSETSETVCPSILSYLQIISSRSEDWKDEFSMFFVRFYWLQSHCFRKTVENELAIRALEAVLEAAASKTGDEGEKFSLNLPNCFKYGFISVQIIDKIIKHLNMIISLGNIESLFNMKKYAEVAEVLKHTFHSGCYSKVGRMGRPAQLGILMHSLWFINWVECFVWTEECLYEAVTNWHRTNVDHDKWEKIIDKCLGFFQEIIQKETVSVLDKLTEEKRCRLVESLARIVCKQINTDNSVGIALGNITAWIVLHYVLLREEQRQYANKRLNQSKRDKIDVHKDSSEPSEQELPASIAILFSAHEFLGPKGWCLTGKGELLHFILDTILDRLDTPVFEPFRDKIDIHIEQALFCLYLYPSKKNKISRHLIDHNVNPIPLSWERSFQLYQYYAPDSLPEFNSYKSQSISADLEQLFRRIIDLVPSTLHLQEQLPKIESFIQGKTDVLPEPVEFPAKVKAVYYLLGDYYFKEREFARCIKYYQLDVGINPLRLDAWAALGLSYAAQLENSLNHCEKLKNESDFFDKAKSAQICFRKALELDPDNLVLWIECGSFEYLVHSFCSRLIKFESENFSMEKFELLETQKDSYLDSSGGSLEHAIALYAADDSNEPDERWLQYYLLGKIAEKKRKEPTEYLQHYLRASALLHENKATYPNKISYNNPQHLSVEALELHYRIHASILKYLELHEGKDVSNTLGALFKKCLQATSERYDVVVPPPPEPPAKLDQSTLSFQEQFVNSVKAQQADSDVKACLEEILDKVVRQDDPDVSIVETEDVVMVISDSDEEVVPASCKEDKKEEIDGTGVVQDVQSMLDKMMEATMIDTTKPDSLELNNSGGEENKTNSEPVNKDKEEVPKPKITEKEIKKTNEEDSNSSSSSSSSDSASSDSESEDSDSSSSSSSSGSTNGNLSNTETLQLVDKCIEGLEKCITRLPQNYKALYRLAHLYFNYKTRKDYTKCKQLLLGEYKCKNDMLVNGLFSDRSSKNFFNGIWRIPSTEIDRPGSLAAHMNRCVSLMLQVLRNSNDTKTLMELCMQLRKVPDRDKIYIRDSDRTSYAEQAMDMCVQSFRSQIKNVPDMQKVQVIKLLHDIFKVFQRVQKYIPSKESVFSDLLCNSYKAYVKDGVSENANLLDSAVKFCQQHRPVEKPKPPTPVFASRGPGLTAGTVPVLPTPSTLIAPQKPLKPSGIGRPRGRPPLPKMPGQIRQHRTKSPSGSTPYPWQSSMYGANFNYEYLKHYQDELIKQYSQNLNLTQLQQLSNYFTSGRLNTSAQTLTNQFLASSNLLGTSNLLRPGGSTPLLDQAALQKMLSTQMPSSSLSSLTLDQKKFLESMLPSSFTSSVPTSTSSAPASIFGTAKSSKSHTVVSSNKYPNVNPSETKGLMKDRPNISITPVTSTLPPSQTKPSSIKTHPVSSPMILSSVTATSKPSTTYKAPLPISEVAAATRMSHTSSSATFPPKFTATLQAPAAHSSTSPKHAHSLPATPPPTSSPSYMKTSTSPGKTLQQKLAEKKKEQETKQMMQNIESEIFATKLPPAPSAGLLKSLNIPSSLTVSPSKMPEKPPGTSYSNFSASHLMGHVGDLKMPPSLTVSQSMPQPLYAPKFPTDSGVSISQVSNDDRNKPPKKTPAADVSTLKKHYPNPKKNQNLHDRSVPIKLPYKKSAIPYFREDKSSSNRRKVDHYSGKSNKLVDKVANHALSVIKNLSSIDITPVSVGFVDKNKTKEGQVEEDVIVLD